MVVAVAPVHFELVAVCDAGRFAGDGLAVADLDGVGGVEVDDAVVFHVDAGDAVAGGGHEKGVVEADFERAGFDFVVPIDGLVARAKAEVPLAHHAGRVTGLLEHRRQRRLAVSMHNLASPGRMPVPFLRQAYCPVSIE